MIDMYDKNVDLICRCVHDYAHHNKWDRMGKAIGRNTSICDLGLSLEEENAISDVVYECLEAFYRGVEGN